MNIQKLIHLRHWVQWGFLATLVLLPFTGLIWFDAGTGRFFVAGHQVWMHDFWLVLGAVGLVLCSVSLFFYPLGQSFCGWLCPQFTVSEALGGLLSRLLGRHVRTGFDPDRGKGRSARTRLSRMAGWAVFAGVVVLVSLAATVTVMHYFFPTRELFERLLDPLGNLLFLGFLVVLTWFFAFDFGFVRHFWCRYMCVFGLYQYLFRGRDTLRIRFQEDRADDCRRCTLCKDVCPMGLDPRQPEIDTRCINCGICIDVCESYMGRFDKARLLDFGFGNRSGELIRIKSGGSPARSARVYWPLAGALGSAALLVYGLMTFAPLDLVVHQENTDFGTADGISYSAVVSNKDVTPATFHVTIEGLPAAQVTLGHEPVTVAAGGRATVPFRVDRAGLEINRPYPFRFILTRDDGGAPVATGATYFFPAM